MLRWGIIGASGVADRRMMPAINLSEANELHALMVRDIERAKELAKKHGAKAYYDSIDELLADPDVDAVHIATPVYLHCEHTIKAAEHGKHVLCEKPMAMNVEECQRMIDACNKNHVLLQIAFTLRFNPCFHEIRQIIQDGLLGDIVEARVCLLKSYDIPKGAWRRNPSMSGGGVLMDMGVHAIDMLCFLLGDASSVAMLHSSHIKNWEVEDTASVLLKMKSGAIAIADVSFSIPYSDRTLEVYGTKGSIFLFNQEAYQAYRLKLIAEDHSKEELKPSQNLYKNMVEHFQRCVNGEEEPISPALAGLKNIQIVNSAYESFRNRKIVEIS